MKKNRFKKLYLADEKLDYLERTNVIVDTETGVQYLVYTINPLSHTGAGITVLLDKDGKPLLAEEV